MQATDKDILLLARGVAVPAGEKQPRVEIVAYGGGLMDGHAPYPRRRPTIKEKFHTK